MRNGDWLSLHAFISRPTHGDAMPLFADRLLAEIGAERGDWFFIRYAEGGPHVRLRFAPSMTPYFGRLRHEVERECAALAVAAPDQHWTSAPAGADASQHQCRPGSVHEIAYVPETRRYGGEQALLVNETLFRLSTGIAIKVIAATPIDLARRAQVAVGLMIGAASALCESVEALADFLAEYESFWRGLLPEDQGAPSSRSFGAAESLPDRFQRHRRGLEAGAASNALADCWCEAIRQACRQFEALHQAGSLVSPRTGRAASDLEDMRAACRSIVGSQIHMLNNRLGFTPIEEAGWAAELRRMLPSVYVAGAGG